MKSDHPPGTRRHGMRRTLALSFLTLLLLSLITNAAMYVTAYRRLEEETQHSIEATIGQFCYAFDERLQAVLSALDNISANTDLLALAASDGAGKPPSSYQLFSLRKQLSTIRLGYLQDLFVYFGSSDKVLSAYNSALSPEQYGLSYYTDSECLRNVLRQHPQSPDTTILPLEIGQGRTGLCIFRLLIASYSNNTVTIGAVMSDFDLMPLLHSYAKSLRGSIMLLSSDGTPLISSDGSFALAASPDVRSPGRHTGAYDGDEYMICTVSSGVSEIVYVAAVPRSVYMEKMSAFRLLEFLTILLHIVIGLATVILLTRYNYKPVRDFILSAESLAKRKFAAEKTHELDFASSVLSETHRENERIAGELRARESERSVLFVQRLLYGMQPYAANICEDFRRNGLTAVSDRFAVAHFWIDGWDKEPFSSRYTGHKNPGEAAAVRSLIESCFEGCHPCFVLHSDRSVFICLINAADPEDEGIEDELCILCEHARVELEAGTGVSCTAGLSELCTGYAGIAEANLHARRAMEYRLILGKRRLIRFSELEEHPFVPSKHFHERAVNLLTSYLKTGEGSSFEVFYRIEAEYMGENCPTPEAAGAFVSNLNAVTAEVGAFFESRVDKNESFVILKTGDTMDDISKRFGYIFFKMREEIAGRESQDHLSARIREYITAQYADPSLCVNSIGYHFGLTPAYCSRIFKDACGATIPAFILDLRIRAACERLTLSGDSIDDIALQTGFSSASVFIRQFKKQCGVTPGAYRSAWEHKNA